MAAARARNENCLATEMVSAAAERHRAPFRPLDRPWRPPRSRLSASAAATTGSACLLAIVPTCGLSVSMRRHSPTVPALVVVGGGACPGSLGPDWRSTGVGRRRHHCICAEGLSPLRRERRRPSGTSAARGSPPPPQPARAEAIRSTPASRWCSAAPRR